jgi:hypothetical protein
MATHTTQAVKDLPQRRPAETTAAASSVALLICWAAGVDDPAVLAAIGIVIGFIPSAVTWLVVTIRSRDEG